MPSVDRRAVEVRRSDTIFKFEPYRKKEEWIARARFLRQQILLSRTWKSILARNLQLTKIGRNMRDNA